MGVAWIGSQASMQEFVDRHGLTFPNVNDDDGDVFAAFDVIGQPAWAFSDGRGGIEVRPGTLSDDELDAILEDLSAA